MAVNHASLRSMIEDPSTQTFTKSLSVPQIEKISTWINLSWVQTPCTRNLMAPCFRYSPRSPIIIITKIQIDFLRPICVEGKSCLSPISGPWLRQSVGHFQSGIKIIKVR